jgi:hypothetical protein
LFLPGRGGYALPTASSSLLSGRGSGAADALYLSEAAPHLSLLPNQVREAPLPLHFASARRQEDVARLWITATPWERAHLIEACGVQDAHHDKTLAARSIAASLDGNRLVAPKISFSANRFSILTYNMLGSPILTGLSDGWAALLDRFAPGMPQQPVFDLPQRTTSSEPTLSESERYAAQVGLICQLDPSLTAIQEAWSKKTRIALKNSGYHVAFATPDVGRFGGLLGKTVNGLAVLSKTPITLNRFFPFKNKSGIEGFISKGAQLIETDISGYGLIQLWNIHLASPPELINWATQKEALAVRRLQNRELQELIAKHSRSGIPIFVAGDTNAIYPEEYQHLSALGEDLLLTRYPHWRAECDTNPDLNLGPNAITFDLTNPRAGSDALPFSGRLDRIYAGDGLPTICALSAKSVLCAPGERYSDHYGFMVEVLFPKLRDEEWLLSA